jgi:hypothetical protein
LSLNLFATDPTGESNINKSSNYFLPSVIDSSGFAFSYKPGNFGIDELSEISIIWYDHSIIPLAAKVSSFNNDIYNNYVLNLNLAYNFGDSYHIGLGGKYQQFIIQGFDSQNNFTIDLSGRVNATKELSAGFYYQNLFGNSLSTLLNEPTQVFHISIAWSLSEDLALSFGSTNWIPGRSWFFVATRYKINEYLQSYLRVYGTDMRLNFGISMSISDFLFNPEIDYHSKLGFSQSYLIEYYY